MKKFNLSYLIIVLIFAYSCKLAKNQYIEAPISFSVPDNDLSYEFDFVEVKDEVFLEILDAVISKLDTSIFARDTVPVVIAFHGTYSKDKEKTKYGFYVFTTIGGYLDVVHKQGVKVFYHKNYLFVISSRNVEINNKLFKDLERKEKVFLPKRAYELGTIYFDPRNKYLVLSFHYRSLYVIGLDGEVQEFFDYNEYLEL
jgi:hypothetical protein